MREPHLSLVIPVYNAAPFLRQSLLLASAFVERQPYSCEVVVSDDGSNDGSAEILAELSGRVRTVIGQRHRGKGNALREGVFAAAGRFVVFTDADLPYGLDAVALLVRQLEEQHFDLVVGSRDIRHPPADSQPPWSRRIASRTFASLVAHVVPTGVADTQCGLKGFRQPVARYLFARSRIDGFAFDVEVLSIAHAKGLRLGKLPLEPIKKRYSTVRLLRDALHMSLDVARIRRNHRLDRYRLDDELT